MKYLTICLSFLALAPAILSAQTSAESELQRLITAYNALDQYHFRLRYDFFSQGQPNAAESKTGISILKNGVKYLKIDQLESIVTIDQVLVVNREERYVILDKSANYPQYASQDIQSTLRQIQQQKVRVNMQAIGSLKSLQVFEPGGMTPICEIQYNAAFQIEKLIMPVQEEDPEQTAGVAFKQLGRLVVSIEQLPVTDIPLKINTVVSSIAGGYRLTKAFQKFQFYNMIQS